MFSEYPNETKSTNYTRCKKLVSDWTDRIKVGSLQDVEVLC